MSGGYWFLKRVTNEDGRCGNLLTLAELRAGIYRVHFDTSAYFLSVGNFEPFYPYVDVSNIWTWLTCYCLL